MVEFEKRPPTEVKDSISETSDSGLTIEREEIYLNREFKREQLATLKQNNTERKRYARNIFFFTVGWAIAIIAIVLFCGWEFHSFKLSDTVLVTLITTTTVNFFGFFLLVVKYLFNPNKST